MSSFKTKLGLFDTVYAQSASSLTSAPNSVVTFSPPRNNTSFSTVFIDLGYSESEIHLSYMASDSILAATVFELGDVLAGSPPL